jgi:hypothetical protein
MIGEVILTIGGGLMIFSWLGMIVMSFGLSIKKGIIYLLFPLVIWTWGRRDQPRLFTTFMAGIAFFIIGCLLS